MYEAQASAMYGVTALGELGKRALLGTMAGGATSRAFMDVVGREVFASNWALVLETKLDTIGVDEATILAPGIRVTRLVPEGSTPAPGHVVGSPPEAYDTGWADLALFVGGWSSRAVSWWR